MFLYFQDQESDEFLFVAIIWYFVRFSFFLCFPPLFFSPFNPLALNRKKKRIERKGAVLSLNYFLLTRGVEGLGAGMIFTVKISNFFF